MGSVAIMDINRVLVGTETPIFYSIDTWEFRKQNVSLRKTKNILKMGSITENAQLDYQN